MHLSQIALAFSCNYGKIAGYLEIYISRLLKLLLITTRLVKWQVLSSFNIFDQVLTTDFHQKGKTKKEKEPFLAVKKNGHTIDFHQNNTSLDVNL